LAESEETFVSVYMGRCELMNKSNFSVDTWALRCMFIQWWQRSDKRWSLVWSIIGI